MVGDSSCVSLTLDTITGMADDPQTEPPADESERLGQTAADEESYVEAYDLDGDGDVSPVEDVRAVLGLADARLEQIAEDGGVAGKIAEAAHHVVDKLDND